MKISKTFNIPIYNVRLYLIVTDNIAEERYKMSEILGAPNERFNDCEGLCCSGSSGEFAVFYDIECLSENLISHEIFHLTHRILEYTNSGFDKDHHEQGAMLNGFLSKIIRAEINKRLNIEENI